jgi:type I restriction enzyme, S subunit
MQKLMKSNFKKTTIGKIPNQWKAIKLEDIISDFIVPMRDKPKKFEGNIPWCRIEDIEGKYLSGTKSNQYVDENTIDEMKLKIHPKGTVICSCSARLGVCAITTTDLITNQTFIGLVPSEKVDKEFLYYIMTYSSERLQRLSSGTTIAYLSRKEFEKFRIPYPPISEQQKIASILSTWDKAIELKEKLIEQKKEQKKGLMQKLLTGEVRLPGFEGKWKKVKLKEISVCLDNLRRPINSKEREKMKGNIPYYGANGIVDYVNDYLFDEPLILVAEDGGHFNEFRDRPIAIKIEGKAWVNNHAHVLRIINSDYDFVYYSLVHKDIRKYINGSTRGKLTQSDMLAIELILPDSIEEQKAISHILMKIDLNIELLERELNELKCQKKGLMQLLLTGKVRVKV